MVYTYQAIAHLDARGMFGGISASRLSGLHVVLPHVDTASDKLGNEGLILLSEYALHGVWLSILHMHFWRETRWGLRVQ